MTRAAAVLLAVVASLALHAAAPRALRADEAGASAKAEADRLFAEGKQRLQQRDYAQACPLLARSFELDPATGALLALAVCREREGKLASAFAAYSEAAARSQREQRSDREQAARAKAAALEPKLSKLTLETAPADRAADVRLNGARIDPARLGTPIAVDGGDQLIEASAEGKDAFRMRISVAASADAQTVIIPELTAKPAPELPPPAPAPAAAAAVPAPAALPAPVVVARHDPPPRRRSEAPALSASQWVGIGSMGLGVVGLGIGTYLALADEPKPDPECAPPRCLAAEESDPDDAAALAFVAGGVLAVSGLAIYLIHGPSSDSDADADSAGITRVTAWAVPNSAGVAVDARF